MNFLPATVSALTLEVLLSVLKLSFLGINSKLESVYRLF